MTSEPVDRYSGSPLSEWIATLPNEFEFDAVSLWEIIPGLRDSFGLEGGALEHAIRQALAEVLARGARPVVGCSEDGSWRETTRYGDSPNDIINAVIAEWHRMGRDPDVGDVWFALPALYESRG
jgi:hypothetical protein